MGLGEEGFESTVIDVVTPSGESIAADLGGSGNWVVGPASRFLSFVRGTAVSSRLSRRVEEDKDFAN